MPAAEGDPTCAFRVFDRTLRGNQSTVGGISGTEMCLWR